MEDRLLTMSETAELLRSNIDTLRWWRAKGDIGPKSAKLGRRVVYRESDVLAWIDAKFSGTA